jgi:hypothetical protein
MFTTKARAVGVALAVAAALPGSAVAVTVTLGPTGFGGSSGGGATGCLTFSGCSFTFSQTARPEPGTVVIAPSDGTITSWRVLGSVGGDGQLRLRVIHPAVGGQFAGAGTSAPATALDGMAANVTSLPIQAGDYIGVDASADSSGSALLSFRSVSGASYNHWTPALADASMMSPAAPTPDRVLDVNVSVQLTPPVVTGLSRSSGSTAGGETVTITGAHLAGATQVRFGSMRATSLSVSNSQLTTTAPAAAAGTVDLRVTTPAGTSDPSPGDQYTFLAPRTPPPPPGKTVRPVAAYGLSPSTFAAAEKGGSIATARTSLAKKKPGIGTTVRFRLSERATVIFTVEQQLAGRGVKGSCVKPTMDNRTCTRSATLKRRFTLAARLGKNSFRFTGRLGGKKLSPGAYRLVATAADASGNLSVPKRMRFKIVTG